MVEEVKTCLVIVGPTAVGKTSTAIRLAQEFNTKIISADSRQCYKELNIGVAKPSAAQLELITHYFINSHSITEEVNAALFEQYALDAASAIFSESNTLVMVGGTGMYVNAFCYGLDEMPVVLPEVRAQIQSGYQESGLSWLQDQVSQNDPVYYAEGEISNPHRLMRSLEVKLSTGRSIKEFQTNKKKNRDFQIIKIGLELPRNALYRNIENRVNEMIEAGLPGEAGALLPFRHLNALNTVGYKELFRYLDGEIPLDQAIGLIKQNTRHYAKRQLTWFRKEESTMWFQPGDIQNIINYCKAEAGKGLKST